ECSFGQPLHASVTLRCVSNGRHVTVSVTEGCRAICTEGIDINCGWDEQGGDVIVASGGYE
ncbi:hypothetical protein LSAT2_016860, partial [Lamellibrachia satsuma]